jgi:hypothetical protein
MMGTFMICTPHRMSLGDPVKEERIGEECGTHGIQEKCMHGIG